VDFGTLPHIDYSKQVEILRAKLNRFGNPKALVDASAAGTAVIELMRACGMNVEEFKFTKESKAKIVTDLVVGFEQQHILLPATGRTVDERSAAHQLEEQLFNFEPTLLQSGNIRYEAAGGYFDDLVMAVCLAYAGASRVPYEPWAEFIDFDSGAAGDDPRERRCRWDKISA
jgi:hypothetical protein